MNYYKELFIITFKELFIITYLKKDPKKLCLTLNIFYLFAADVRFLLYFLYKIQYGL